MLCPTCFGHRLFYFQGRYLPCPDCEGHGEIHCCDGLQEQPEPLAAPAGERITIPHGHFEAPQTADRDLAHRRGR